MVYYKTKQDYWLAKMVANSQIVIRKRLLTSRSIMTGEPSRGTRLTVSVSEQTRPAN